MTETTIALLVAAGKSERMQSDLPKPYLQLGHQMLMRHTVKSFLSHPKIDGVRVVIRREHHPLYRQAIEGLTLFPCVIGGNTRQESVLRGLESLSHRRPTRVLVHDIARPMATHALISRVLAGLDSHTAVIPALKLNDTLRRGKDGTAGETVDRSDLYAVQTPQGFDYATLLAAHRAQAGAELTDDAALIERSGGKVAMVDGDLDNVKLTTSTDFQRMKTLITLSTETRTAMGYDVHALTPHDDDTPPAKQVIKLCGIKIPFTHHLVGHSDADVGLHALVDAILGTISAGDIGMHFPPGDPKWLGADSSRFLIHAYEMLKNQGGELTHADITLICEKPKVAPYREAMIDHIAKLLKINPGRISIKATTTEKLGFAGRGEGIAAQAIATVRLPRL